jgi:hypothetical protein
MVLAKRNPSLLFSSFLCATRHLPFSNQHISFFLSSSYRKHDRGTSTHSHL